MKTQITPTVVKYLEKNGFEILPDGAQKDYISSVETSLGRKELTERRKAIKGQCIYRVWLNGVFYGYRIESELEALKKQVIKDKRKQ